MSESLAVGAPARQSISLDVIPRLLVLQRITMEVKIKFTRTPVDVVETGIAILEMDKGFSEKDIEKKMAEGDFKRFVVRSRTVGDYEWEWETAKA